MPTRGTRDQYAPSVGEHNAPVSIGSRSTALTDALTDGLTDDPCGVEAQSCGLCGFVCYPELLLDVVLYISRTQLRRDVPQRPRLNTTSFQNLA